MLAEAMVTAPARLLLSEHLACDGRAFFRQVVELGCEGIVSKLATGSYTEGPSKTWLKCKHTFTSEYLVIGYVPYGERIEAVLVAERRRRQLRPVGRVEFWSRGVLNEDARRALASRDRSACYIEPRLVATVRHFGRTGEGYLPAPVLQGLSAARDH